MHKEWAVIGKYPGGETAVAESDTLEGAKDFAAAKGLTGTNFVKTAESRRALAMIITRLTRARSNAEQSNDRAYTDGTIGRIDTQIAHYRTLFKSARWTIEDLRAAGWDIWFDKDSGLWKATKPPAHDVWMDQCISKLLRELNEKLTDLVL